MDQCTRLPVSRTAWLSSPGCDELFRAIRISDGKEVFTFRRVPTPALAGAARRLAFYGTFDNEVLMVNLAKRADRVAL